VNALPQAIAYTVRDCASALRCSERTIRRAIAAGKLRSLRVGRLVRVTADSLRHFVEGRQADFDELNTSQGKTHVVDFEEDSRGSHHQAL
jgi:excisionase family DNA binding protein